jgi:hypothetical protein
MLLWDGSIDCPFNLQAANLMLPALCATCRVVPITAHQHCHSLQRRSCHRLLHALFLLQRPQWRLCQDPTKHWTALCQQLRHSSSIAAVHNWNVSVSMWNQWHMHWLQWYGVTKQQETASAPIQQYLIRGTQLAPCCFLQGAPLNSHRPRAVLTSYSAPAAPHQLCCHTAAMAEHGKQLLESSSMTLQPHCSCAIIQAWRCTLFARSSTHPHPPPHLPIPS